MQRPCSSGVMPLVYLPLWLLRPFRCHIDELPALPTHRLHVTVQRGKSGEGGIQRFPPQLPFPPPSTRLTRGRHSPALQMASAATLCPGIWLPLHTLNLHLTFQAQFLSTLGSLISLPAPHYTNTINLHPLRQPGILFGDLKHCSCGDRRLQ
ncbi:paired box protein Pax-2 [Platysternon megacephalum]|uniref:Paired box protein Pax-2 n=1 Tax=Platysternon megacephalum TaxID=55544 RepID=A0A4D9DUZ5_9SAUR|nr:paired box protein Pax-2 [Platysternon megacephalum]